MGMYLAALNSELHGEAWDAPPVETFSREDAAVESAWEAVKDDPEYATATAIKTGGTIDGANAATLGAVWKFASAIAVEKYWHRAAFQSTFLGRDVFEWVVAKVKAEVKELTGGKE